jgi:antiviral helicase SKI2
MEMSNFHELVQDMAMEYPFELDTFQKEAIYHIERSENVFVAAHTSAGMYSKILFGVISCF